jgi:cell division protein FtsB
MMGGKMSEKHLIDELHETVPAKGLAVMAWAMDQNARQLASVTNAVEAYDKQRIAELEAENAALHARIARIQDRLWDLLD